MVDSNSLFDRWPPGRFKPYGRNARTHDEDQITRLAASITQVGFLDPIEVTPDGEILAGHGRLEAAKRLGMTEIPVLVHAGLSAQQVTAYRLANNRLAELSGWDRLTLAAEVQALEELGPVPELGFSDEELRELSRELEGPGAPGGAGDGRQASRGLGTPVISYQLIFESQDQQSRWFDFVRMLRSVYPGDDLTLAGRLDAFLQQTLQEAEA